MNKRQRIAFEVAWQWQRFVERWRWRLLKLLPRRVVYFVIIHAWAKALGSREHPESLSASELARRWQ